VVDIGEPSPRLQQNGSTSTGTTTDLNGFDAGLDNQSGGRDPRISNVITLLGELMPSDSNCPLSPYLSGFMSLRLLLLRSTWSPEEEDLARTMLDSYTSYSQGGRSKSDIGIMMARDYMFLVQNNVNSTSQQHQQPPTQANFFNDGQGSKATLSGNSFEVDFGAASAHEIFCF